MAIVLLIILVIVYVGLGQSFDEFNSELIANKIL